MAPRFQFGPFVLDLARGDLLCDGEPTALSPKAIGVLELLVRHPGELVTKERFLDGVWSDVAVGDAVLKVAISEIRQALGDAAGSPRYVETAHRRGYRFIGKVQPLPEVRTARARNPSRYAALPSIAVLPFEDMSREPKGDYFADGVCEDLLTRLTQWGALPVLSRGSTFAYRGRAVDVDLLRREIGCRYVVEGSVRHDGGRIRLTAQLIDAKTGHHLWAESYDREEGDLFAIQDEVTQLILSSVEHGVTVVAGSRSDGDPASFEAWDHVQRAEWLLSKRTTEDNVRARACLREALELEPQLAQAYELLAASHLNDAFFLLVASPIDSIRLGDEAARQALSLNDRLWGAHSALGLAASALGRPREGLRSLRRAVEVAPSQAWAHVFLGASQAFVGDCDDALAALDQAMRLSPRDPDLPEMQRYVACAHFGAGHDEEALAWSRQSLAGEANWLATIVEAASAGHLGRTRESRTAMARLREQVPDFSWALPESLLGARSADFVARLRSGCRDLVSPPA